MAGESQSSTTRDPGALGQARPVRGNRGAAHEPPGARTRPRESSLGLLFRHLSASRLVTIAQIEGRVRGAGSEFVLACDMRFAARESAIFGQPEVALGLIPGAGGVQHLARLMGRARALEAAMVRETGE